MNRPERLTPEQVRQREGERVMAGPLGAEVWEVYTWAREHWGPVTELLVNPEDEGAGVLDGGVVYGCPLRTSSRVPRGGALAYCRTRDVYVRKGEQPPDRRVTDVS